MTAPGSVPRYHLVAQLFHWLAALLLVGLLITNLLRLGTPSEHEARMWLNWHMSLGLTLFVLTGARILWARLVPPPPPVPAPLWSQIAARAVHVLLNLATLLIPIFGYLRITAHGHTASFFGLPVPALVGENVWLQNAMEVFHGAPVMIALLSLVAVHIAAALWHHYVRRDGALERMLPWRVKGAG